MKTTIHWLPTLLGCTGLATVSLGMSGQALAASCGKPMHASGPHALAGPARPSEGIGLKHRHDSFLGLWHVVYTSGGVTMQESFDQWHADGLEFEVADLQIGAMCQGTWEQTEPGTVKLFHVGWNFDPTGTTLIGSFIMVQSDTLSADGNTYDGTFLIQNFDLSGNHVPGDLSGPVHATRLP